MRYTTENGKNIVIPDKEISKLMEQLNLSKEEAIDLWLDDNGIEINEEAENLNKTASKVKILHDSGQNERKKSEKPREKHISDEKKEVFSNILDTLKELYEENVTVLNENKLISLKIGEKTFKIDIIECRPPKKK